MLPESPESITDLYRVPLTFFLCLFLLVKSRFSWGQSNVLIRGYLPGYLLLRAGLLYTPVDIRMELSTFAYILKMGRGRPSHRLACSEYLLT